MLCGNNILHNLTVSAALAIVVDSIECDSTIAIGVLLRHDVPRYENRLVLGNYWALRLMPVAFIVHIFVVDSSTIGDARVILRRLRYVFLLLLFWVLRKLRHGRLNVDPSFLLRRALLIVTYGLHCVPDLLQLARDISVFQYCVITIEYYPCVHHFYEV